jgi:hypothetical protein
VSVISNWAFKKMADRQPDYVIGGWENPYMFRWWIIPRNRFFNIYLHCIVRSDDDRALHDHPWLNCSILINGRYIEHTIEPGGIERRVERKAGSIVWRRPTAAHRLEVLNGEGAISLFITGPRVRDWGFHCPQAGWVHWQDFTSGDNGALIGKGCDQ